GGAGGVDISNGYTTAEKYTTLSTNKLSAGLPSGQDIAHVVSSGNFTINAGDSVTVAFALIAGVGLVDIQASADAAQSAYDNIIGVEEVEENKEFTIYPNPTNGKIYLKMNQIEDLKIKNIVVYNVFGAELSLDVEIKPTSTQQIDLTQLPNGVYFIELQTVNKSYRKKIVLSK
ncbi:MAG TPA: T9SS type A sorting domain-containing protein, partial [Vicingus sp.]|nr:T9SS type A sorting domain-containing protein [Vicingus sp.]